MKYEMEVADNKMNTEVNGRSMTYETSDRYPEDNQANQLSEEFLSSLKESHLTTKKAIDGCISSARKVEKQNEEIIAECKRQLGNKHLLPEQQLEILRIMDEARRDSVDVDRESREYIETKLNYMNALPWVILGLAVLTYGGKKLISSH